jgi:hypothetical protein
MHWRAVLNGAPQKFCCAGCLGIAQTIHVAGLDAFFTIDAPRRAIGRPGQGALDEWSQWDDRFRCRPNSCGDAGRSNARSRCCSKDSLRRASWLIETWLSRRPVGPPASTSPRRARSCSILRWRRDSPTFCARWCRSATTRIRTTGARGFRAAQARTLLLRLPLRCSQ